MKDLVKTAQSVKELIEDLTAEEMAEVLHFATGEQKMHSVTLVIGWVMDSCNAKRAVIEREGDNLSLSLEAAEGDSIKI